MVIAHHIILTGYGHWLPNDPRGSMSRYAWSQDLQGLGACHFGRKSKQPVTRDLRSFYRAAEPRLLYPVLWFNTSDRQAVARSFAQVIGERRYTCYACAILPNHAHLVIRKHRDRVETMVDELKKASVQCARCCVNIPDNHPVWSTAPRNPFIKTIEHLLQAIRYVNDNPRKAGLPPQGYSFVTPYRGEWSGR